MTTVAENGRERLLSSSQAFYGNVKGILRLYFPAVCVVAVPLLTLILIISPPLLFGACGGVKIRL